MKLRSRRGFCGLFAGFYGLSGAIYDMMERDGKRRKNHLGAEQAD